MSSLITHLTDFIQTLYVATGLLGIVLAMAIESCCIPLPSEIVMPLAGSLLAMYGQANAKYMLGVSAGAPLWLNLFLLALAGAVGCLLGSLAAYGIGYAGGRPLMLKYGKYVLISQHDADKADAFFLRWGPATAFFSRLLPVVRTYISLPAGIARMNVVKFTVYSFLGSLPWCLLLAYLGYQLGNHYEQISGPLHYLDGAIVVVVVVLVVLYIWRHIRNDRRARAEHARAAQQPEQQASNPWGNPPFQAQSQLQQNQPSFMNQQMPPMNAPQPWTQAPPAPQRSQPSQPWGPAQTRPPQGNNPGQNNNGWPR